ncbi:WD40 repeat domain-containing protein [Mangrovibacillus sp. Mu-81]|uniref:WD40 repeat domain-containing protein n=1 Tax=Mangrovibacillus sp. Mu-81 TaxID=3121478 RepID=UPI002FE4E411
MKKVFLSIVILLMMLPGAMNGKSVGAESVSKLDSTYFGGPEQLLTPLTDAISIFNGAVGTEDGRPVMYTTTKGLPAQLNVMDIKSEKLLRVIPLEGAENTWAHEVLPNGDLYIATIGGGAKLWKYSPGADTAEVVATFSGETFPFAITSDQGKVYVGTYPSGKVYEYDPANGGVDDYGRMIGESSQEYIRSLAVIGNDVYSGTGHGKIIHYNKETGEKEDIAASIGEQGHIYDLDKVDDRYLFARYELSSNGYVYDTQEREWLDVVIPKARGLHVPEQSEDGKIYFMNTENKLQTFDIKTLAVEDTGIEYGSGFRGVDWVEFGTSDLPGKSLVTINFSGYVSILNLEKKETIKTPVLAQGTANVINKIETGPDGKLYMSGVQTGKGAIYDTVNKTKKVFDMGQGDSIAAFGDKLLFGVYPAGDVREFDPAQEPSDSNPKTLFTLGEEQNRIHSIVEGDGKAYIGSIPFYGELGGALTVYDPEAPDEEKVKTFRNIVEDQSVNSLAYKDGKVYGSTTINGGLGADPTAEEARIFVWDTETEEKVEEITLSIDGLEKPEAIGDLSFGPDGFLWGASIDTIFAMDPETLTIVKSRKLYDSLPLSAWNKIELEWSNDLLYADFSGNLTAIDPNTLDSKQIARVYDFSVGQDGNLYYASRENRTMLHKMEVKPVSDKEEMTVTNHQFERPVKGDDITGWTSMFNTDDQAGYTVSGEEHSHGRKSLKLVDTARNKSVALMSDTIEVSKGEVFETSANLFIKEGTGSFMVRFYDEAGKSIIDKPVHTNTGLNKWQNISITTEAPENAETMRVICYTTSYSMGTVYYDKVEVKKLLFD